VVMDYLIGFFICIFVLYTVAKLQIKYNILKDQKVKPIRYSQSHVHSLVFPLLPKPEKIKKIIKSQASIIDKQNHIKVIIMDNKAYWIKDNTFYTAEMSIDGTVDKDSTTRVDTDSMSKVQLDKMLFIVDKLREGTFDDSGSAGD
jgi:hypothetical protein